MIALSNSGATNEILTLLPLIKRLNVPLISVTGEPLSELAKSSDVHLLASVKTEACPLDLAPTSSTTVALVLGDALAIAVLEARGFTAEEFAFSHPGGALGKRLLLRVRDIMVVEKDIPLVTPEATVAEALYEITQKGLGMTTVCNQDGKLAGVFTDGDLRRVVEDRGDLQATKVAQVMTESARTIPPDTLAAEAMSLMERHRISSLVAVDESQEILGVVTLLSLLKGRYFMTGRAAQKAEAIKLVVLDVDGVMTDGTLTYGGAVESESKSFNVKDGLGIKLLQRQGMKVAIITGRLSEAVERRAQELEIKMLVQGREDKGAALRELLDSMALDSSTVAYMGDDLPDLAALRLAGLATCPCDATEAVLKQPIGWHQLLAGVARCVHCVTSS